jgi:hypothetical protein
MINEEFEKEHINPIVGYIFHSAKQLGLENGPNKLDWQYLKEGTRRISELLKSELTQLRAELAEKATAPLDATEDAKALAKEFYNQTACDEVADWAIQEWMAAFGPWYAAKKLAERHRNSIKVADEYLRSLNDFSEDFIELAAPVMQDFTAMIIREYVEANNLLREKLAERDRQTIKALEYRAKAHLMSHAGSFPEDKFVAWEELALFAQSEIKAFIEKVGKVVKVTSNKVHERGTDAVFEAMRSVAEKEYGG